MLPWHVARVLILIMSCKCMQVYSLVSWVRLLHATHELRVRRVHALTALLVSGTVWTRSASSHVSIPFNKYSQKFLVLETKLQSYRGVYNNSNINLNHENIAMNYKHLNDFSLLKCAIHTILFLWQVNPLLGKLCLPTAMLKVKYLRKKCLETAHLTWSMLTLISSDSLRAPRMFKLLLFWDHDNIKSLLIVSTFFIEKMFSNFF